MTHFNITVSGKVQRVFYRQSTIEIAIKLGIKGFVKNEPDGNVYIEAEGTEQQLNKLVQWCRKGPPQAVVADVKFSAGEIKNFSSFEITQ
ncbi:MAG: acylphosphatase [Bacteroidetes bacterium]|nr:acylphosphatase [Bacteroidota bacterium]